MFWKCRFDWVTFIAMILLIALGTACIASAGMARDAIGFHGMWKTHLATAVFSLAVYFVLAFTDYRRLFAFAAMPAYAGACLLLVAVLVFGATIYGGRRWLWFFQPSEISKLAIVMMLAWIAPRLKGFLGFLSALALVALPVLLILAEPDLGTALTLVPACTLMLLAARVWRRGLITLLALAAVGSAALLGAVAEAEKPGTSAERRAAILKYVPLKEHQVRRVKVFLYPEADISGAGYTIRQAQFAIGSGGLSGKGWRKAETNRLKYLPPSISMNDFIFCVYAEETGFIGSVVLLTLFALLLLPCVRIAWCARDVPGRMFALGFPMLVFAHVFVNLAMSIGLVPITGLPLPFMSAGRTFLVTVIAGLGIVQSVGRFGNAEPEAKGDLTTI